MSSLEPVIENEIIIPPITESTTLLCVICYEDVELKNVETTECGHKFCKKCLTKWKKTKNTCPMCRRNIKKSEPEPEKTCSFSRVLGAWYRNHHSSEQNTPIIRDRFERRLGHQAYPTTFNNLPNGFESPVPFMALSQTQNLILLSYTS